MKKYLLGAALLAGLTLGPTLQVHAQDEVKEANKLNKKRNKLKAKESPLSKESLNYDSEFVVAAASSNLLEVALGQLAQKKAIATEVRDWGQRMEQTHGMAQQELQGIADRLHITLPSGMSDDDRKLYDDVDDRKYLGFDKKYLRTLKELHARTLKRFASAATQLTSPDLQQYAARMLPQLRQDEQTIDQLYARADDRK